jgi:hypothetical protein
MRLRSPTSPPGATSRRRTDPPRRVLLSFRAEAPVGAPAGASPPFHPGAGLVGEGDPLEGGDPLRVLSPARTPDLPAGDDPRTDRGSPSPGSTARGEFSPSPPPRDPSPGPPSPPRDPEATPQRFSSGSTKTGKQEQLQGAGRAEQESEEETPAGRIAGAARAGGDRRLVPSRWADDPSPVAGAPSVTRARKNGPCVCSGRTSVAPRTRGAGQESQEKAELGEERVPGAGERASGGRGAGGGGPREREGAVDPSPVLTVASTPRARKNGPCVCSGRTSAAPRTRGAGQESQKKAALGEERVPGASERAGGGRGTARAGGSRRPKPSAHCRFELQGTKKRPLRLQWPYISCPRNKGRTRENLNSLAAGRGGHKGGAKAHSLLTAAPSRQRARNQG